jgi:hypothetical protein
MCELFSASIYELNLRARVSELRQAGMNIGTIPYTRKDGVNAVKYVLEAPRRARSGR